MTTIPDMTRREAQLVHEFITRWIMEFSADWVPFRTAHANEWYQEQQIHAEWDLPWAFKVDNRRRCARVSKTGMLFFKNYEGK